ncbi:MAG TPA: hypothetical protein DCF63_14290, partial [Planctomycetaceae bacterium]|nr:hypothetical protein [Planctomycetaceae bacterium]
QPATPRLLPQVASHNGTLFLFGGYSSVDGKLQPEFSLEVYDQKDDSWRTLSDNHSMPQFSANTKLVSLQGRLLFLGADATDHSKTRLVIYDPNLPEQPQTVSPMSLAGFASRTVETPEQSAKNIMRKDADKDGLISKSEIGQRMASFFDSADKNRDGFLSHEEVLEAFQSKNGENKSGGHGIEDKDSK